MEPSYFLYIKPGVDSHESKACANTIFGMYLAYFHKKKYKSKIIITTQGDIINKEFSFPITLKIEIFADLSYLVKENGIHRYVRISPFDPKSRRHTSFTKVHFGADSNFKFEDIGNGTEKLVQVRSYIEHPYKMVKNHLNDKTTEHLAAVLCGELDFILG